jgi:5-methylcytosine-specific restriction endonuclease McrA
MVNSSNKAPQGTNDGYKLQKSVISNKKAQNVQNNKQSSEMKQFFMKYWKENKQHTCEACRVWLGSNPLTYMFDHVLEKSKYPELAFEEENIMYLCLQCHDKKTRGHYDDIMKERINYLKTKYKL